MAALLPNLIAGFLLGGLGVALGLALALTLARPTRVADLVNCFALGFAFGALDPPGAIWFYGVIGGLFLALAEALGTRRWAPLLGLGIIGVVVLWLLTGV